LTPNKDTIIIQPDPTDDAQVADIKSEYLAGLKSESVAGFELECMADFIGIRIQNVDVVGKPVQQRAGEPFGAKHGGARVTKEVVRRNIHFALQNVGGR